MNTKDTDQTARMRRLICVCVVRKWQNRFWRGSLMTRGACIKCMNKNPVPNQIICVFWGRFACHGNRPTQCVLQMLPVQMFTRGHICTAVHTVHINPALYLWETNQQVQEHSILEDSYDTKIKHLSRGTLYFWGLLLKIYCKWWMLSFRTPATWKGTEDHVCVREYWCLSVFL